MRNAQNIQDDFDVALTSGIGDIRTLITILNHAIDDKEKAAKESCGNWGHIGDLDPIIKNLKEAIAATGYLNEDGNDL